MLEDIQESLRVHILPFLFWLKGQVAKKAKTQHRELKKVNES